MTERYTGWTRQVLQCDTPEEADAQDTRNSIALSSFSGFTTINKPRNQVVNPEYASCYTEITNHGTSRNPRVLAQYLGLGKGDTEDSHLDQLATVKVTPPSSPSERNIPKRKRVGERIANEIRQAAKRARSTPEERNDFGDPAHTETPACRSNTACRRASAAHSDHTKGNHFSSPPEAGPTACSSRSMPNVSLSQNTLSQLNTWKYDSQLTKDASPVNEPQQYNGTVSLVTPATSIDLIQALTGRNCSPNNATPGIQVSSVNHQVQQQSLKSVPRKRRGPSTGQALDAIPEESCAKSELKSGRIANDDEWTFPQSTPQASRRRANSSSAPVFHANPLLVSTSRESCPPVQRRHQATDITSMQLVNDHFDDLVYLDEDDLLELGCALVNTLETSAARGGGQRQVASAPYAVQMPTPETSDDTAFDGIDDDEWLQLPDVELETIDLTGTAPDQTTNKMRAPYGNEVSRALQDGVTNEAGAKILDLGAPSSETSITSPAPLAPFARPKFPASIRDRSPLLNITSSLVLKTCFRIGEAINIGGHYARQASSLISDAILIELYARIVSSWRPSRNSGARQDFVFADLWSEKGPRLQGEWTGWKGSKLFELDAKNLLADADTQSDGKMCRAIGRMKRENKEWRFVVLNAWECGWNDVEHVRGIVCHG